MKSAMDLDLKKEAENVFVGSLSGGCNKSAIFGGSLISQSIMAAYKSVIKDMHLHSLQVYFLARGDSSMPITYVIESTMDGRSFMKRLVIVEQNKNIIANVHLSFKIDEPLSVFHYIPKLEQLVQPVDLQFLTDAILDKIRTSDNSKIIGKLKHHLSWLADFPFEIKPCNIDIHTRTFTNPSTKLYTWVRLKEELLLSNENCAAKHALLGFISDYLILQPILTMFNDQSVGFLVSLDHTMWLHNHTFDLRQWFLIEVECNIANDGMSLNNGKIWSFDGVLLVTYMQQGVLRQPK